MVYCIVVHLSTQARSGFCVCLLQGILGECQSRVCWQELMLLGNLTLNNYHVWLSTQTIKFLTCVYFFHLTFVCSWCPENKLGAREAETLHRWREESTILILNGNAICPPLVQFRHLLSLLNGGQQRWAELCLCHLRGTTSWCCLSMSFRTPALVILLPVGGQQQLDPASKYGCWEWKWWKVHL